VQYCADRSAHFVNDLARCNKLFTDVLEGAGFDPAERIGPAMLRELDEIHGREPEAGVRQPNSGTSASKVVASTGPTPGTLTSNCSCSRHAGRRCISSLSVRFHALQLPAQPAHVGPDLLLHPQRGARQPVLFGRHHLHELAAPCQPVLQLLGQGIRQRPDRRPHHAPKWARMAAEIVSVLASLPLARPKSRTWRGA
jgi:hypothetical protein